MHYVEYDSDSSSSYDDVPNEVYAAEFMWPPKAKSYSCDSLKPVHKNRQEEMKFTFGVAKCCRIYLMNGIKLVILNVCTKYHQ